MESASAVSVSTKAGEVTYHRYALAPDEPVMPELIKLYQDVFAAPPWNEYLKCSSCGAKCSLGTAGILEERFGHSNNCVHCPEGKHVPFWSDEEVVADFRGALLGPFSVCFLARCNGKLVGFTTGRAYEVEEFDRELKLPGTAQALEQIFGKGQRYAYQDEIAVADTHRQLGIAKQLFQLRSEEFERSGLSVGVARTQTRPQTVTFSWYTRLHYAIVNAYGDKGGRVVMARELREPLLFVRL